MGDAKSAIVSCRAAPEFKNKKQTYVFCLPRAKPPIPSAKFLSPQVFDLIGSALLKHHVPG